jgi:hypothetical protein
VARQDAVQRVGGLDEHGKVTLRIRVHAQERRDTTRVDHIPGMVAVGLDERGDELRGGRVDRDVVPESE